MKLIKLVLTNVRCYQHVEIDFADYNDDEIKPRNSTIILGNNGTGKTTILKSIALLLSGSSALGELIGNPDNWIKHQSNECKIEGHLKTSKGEDRMLQIIIQRGDSLSKIISRNEESLNQLDDALEHTERNYLNLGYGIHRRIGGSGFESKSSTFTSVRSENVATLFNSQSSLYPFESWIMDVDYQKGEAGLASIKKSINSLVPDSQFHSIDKKKKKVLFKNKDGILEFDQLSDGYQITTNWLGDLLYRIFQAYGDYKDPFGAQFILLVDEIGLHLHPAWQRVMVQKILTIFKNVQIIATTHSPFIAQQAKENELFTIIRDDNKNLNLFHYQNDPRKLLIHQIIMSDLFGISTDESIYVEKAKNKMREDPSNNDQAVIKTAKVSSRGIDNLEEVPLNQYTYESSDFRDVISKLKEEVKKIEDEKAS